MIWRIPVSVILWLARLAVFLPLAIIGIPIVCILARAGWCEPIFSARFNRTVLQWRTRWLFWLYSNCEDGIDGLRGGDPAQQWWADKTRGMTSQKRIFKWSALRNPVNNLRYVPFINPKFHSDRIRFVGLDHEMQDGEGGWFFIWQGLYSGFRFETARWRFWMGWKFRPEDAKGVAADDTRLPRADFACQLKRIA